MIEGITILNQTEIMTVPGWCVFGCCVCIFAAVVLVLIGMASGSIGCIITSLIPLASTLIILMFGLADMVGTGRYEYEVTIDESVDFIDIYENYDVIEQRGDIWVIEDKEID